MPDTSSVSAITIADDARSPDASLGIELPRTAPTTELDSRGRQRRPRWPRNFGEIFAAERAHLGLIVVKVVDGAGLRLRRGVVTDVSRSVGLDAERLSEFGVREAEIPRHAESLRALLATIEGATVTSLISEDLESWHDTNRERNETRLRQQFEDRTSFWFIARRGMSETETRDVLARLRRHPLIEYAYVQPQGSPPRSAPACTDQLPGTTPSLAVLETYQQAPPSGSQFAGLAPDATQLTGLDITFARTVTGAAGAGVVVTDVESGFEEEHEDLPFVEVVPSAWVPLNSTLDWLQNHGSASVGVLAACSGAFGNHGIVPAAKVEFSPIGFVLGPWYAPSLAITMAEAHGADVILIEQQMHDYSTTGCYTCGGMSCSDWVPVEYYPVEHAAIRGAVANGRHVVEAAGNGQRNLDFVLPLVQPGSPLYSGAIMVGGVSRQATVKGGHPNICGTGGFNGAGNVGTRVDVSAWYESVATLGYGVATDSPTFAQRYNTSNQDDRRQWYYGLFSGTSSASAIVAGVAGSVVGLYRNMVGASPPPDALRSFLRATAVPQPPGPANISGPTVKLGMAAAAFQDRFVGDSTTYPIERFSSAIDVEDATIVAARQPSSLWVYNVLRGAAWYGWSGLPAWVVPGSTSPTAYDHVQLFRSRTSPTMVVDALAIDPLGRLIVSTANTIEPLAASASAFAAWQIAAPTATGGVQHVTPAQFDPNYTEAFVVSTSGAVRWLYRDAGGGAWGESPFSVPTPASIASKIVAVATPSGRLDLFALRPDQQLVHAWFENNTWYGWVPIAGAGGVQNFDAIAVWNEGSGFRRFLIAAGWAQDTTLFSLDVPTNTVTFAYAGTTHPKQVMLMGGWNFGYIGARLAIVDDLNRASVRTVLQGGAFAVGSAFTTTHPVSTPIVSARLRTEDVRVVLAATNATSPSSPNRPVFRVVTSSFPRP
jgi:hypothetical protein